MTTPDKATDASGPPVEPHALAQPAASDLSAPVSDAQIKAGLSEDFALEARELEENLLRRTADKHLIEDLSDDGFSGERYEYFADDLARYGMSVMRGWLNSGHIFKLTGKRGFAQNPSENELYNFATDHDLRSELATVTVASALPQFRERALVGAGWKSDAGASITTYFMGACVFAFPNELRRHRVQQARWGRQDASSIIYDLDRGQVNDPAVLATGATRVREDLMRVSPRQRQIVAATMDGYSQAEMVEMFGEQSVRAVEGALYRWRTSEKLRLRNGGER